MGVKMYQNYWHFSQQVFGPVVEKFYTHLKKALSEEYGLADLFGTAILYEFRSLESLHQLQERGVKDLHGQATEISAVLQAYITSDFSILKTGNGIADEALLKNQYIFNVMQAAALSETFCELVEKTGALVNPIVLAVARAHANTSLDVLNIEPLLGIPLGLYLRDKKAYRAKLCEKVYL